MWKWWTTPAEPRGRYAVLCGVATGGFLLISSPLWEGEGLVVIGVAGGLSALVASAGVKLLMEGGKS